MLAGLLRSTAAQSLIRIDTCRQIGYTFVMIIQIMYRIATLCLVFCSIVSLAQVPAKRGNLPVQAISLGEVHTIQSAALGEQRSLNMYLPPGYSRDDTTRYDVIYLLDGGIDEDYIHIVGLVQFNSMEWIARLRPAIVVGIINTDRKRDFTFPTTVSADKAKYPTTGGSAKFISFLDNELKPYIKANFNVSSSATLIGQSLGGLLATEILLTKTQMFDRYIIVSPSVWWNNGTLLQLRGAITASFPSMSTSVYIGVGKEGLAPTEQPHVMEVDANLLKEKIENYNNKNLKVYFDYLPGEDHATIGHQAVLNAFRQLNSDAPHK